MNQLRDLIGHYQVRKMVYSVKHTPSCICKDSSAFEIEMFAFVFIGTLFFLKKGQHFSDLNTCFDCCTFVIVSYRYDWNDLEYNIE